MKNWKITHDSFVLEENNREESLFTIANGYMGLRGDMEEVIDAPYSKRGTFLNGFYESSTIPYGEVAYGYAKNTQTMLNVADAKQIGLAVDGEAFSIREAELSTYERSLNMQEGTLARNLVWNSKNSGRIAIESLRLASMTRENIAVVTYKVTAMDQDITAEVVSGIDGTQKTGEESDDPRIAGGLGDGAFDVASVTIVEEPEGNVLAVAQEAKNSGQYVNCLVKNVFFKPKNETFQLHEYTKVTGKAEEKVKITLKKGESLELQKFICYTTNRHNSKENCMEMGRKVLKNAVEAGVNTLLAEQTAYYKSFWENADIVFAEDPKLTLSMRFNIFHLLQAVGKDSYTSIAAKGLSGEGYGGHYFWESEAYIMPVFLHTKPEIAKSLLEYRYRILDKAREQARLLGHEKGALYSWRSIDGEECSAFFLGGSSQYHINADVAFGVARYMDAVPDGEFFRNCAVEILLETARLWINVGHYNEHKDGSFCIDGVTGPDEYTAMVNNNFYTNVMARENLWNAVKFAKAMKEKFPEDYAVLCKKIGFDESELEEFRNAADHMYIPYDEKLQIHKQDDTFLDKKKWDLSEIPPENHPLLTHYHPLYIYRHQVCKQADLILAEYYLPQYFSREEKLRDYNYYEKVTTHDSSLSASIFSIMAADTGDIEKAYQYFIQTVRTDLDDNQKNTRDGLHMANMAGAWLCIVHGFAGMKVTDGTLSFQPILPEEWKGYEFTVCYRGVKLHINVCPDKVCYELCEGAVEMQILHKGSLVNLHQGVNEVAN